MKKLALRLDDLRVETFTTADRQAERGTVQGHYGTTHSAAVETCQFTCDTCGGSTCDYTCEGFATIADGRHFCVRC